MAKPMNWRGNRGRGNHRWMINGGTRTGTTVGIYLFDDPADWKEVPMLHGCELIEDGFDSAADAITRTNEIDKLTRDEILALRRDQ